MQLIIHFCLLVNMIQFGLWIYRPFKEKSSPWKESVHWMHSSWESRIRSITACASCGHITGVQVAKQRNWTTSINKILKATNDDTPMQQQYCTLTGCWLVSRSCLSLWNHSWNGIKQLYLRKCKSGQGTRERRERDNSHGEVYYQSTWLFSWLTCPLNGTWY